MMVLALPFSEHKNLRVPPKEENDDEIEAMAKKIKLYNDKKMAQMTPLVWNHDHSAVEHTPQQPENLPSDWTSVQGQFGWEEFEKDVIPYIIRDGQKYIAERMIEIKLLMQYRYIFHEDLFCYSVKKLSLTVAEKELLDEINKTHCDCSYGSVGFSTRDNILLSEDVMEICKFMNFCYEVLVNKRQPVVRQCGFIRIADTNSSNNVPYVLYQSKYYVPLFYFDGTSVEFLEKKAIQISGWPLTYLKLAFKVHGIGCRHYEKDKLEVVEFDLVKRFYTAGTTFEECWLTNAYVDHLVKNKPNSTQWSNQQQANCDPPPTTNGSLTENRYLPPVISPQSRFQNGPTVRQSNGNHRPFSSPLQAMTPPVQRCNNQNYSYYQNHQFSTAKNVSQNQNKPPPPYPNYPNLSSTTRNSTLYHNSGNSSLASIPHSLNQHTTNNSSVGPLRLSLTNSTTGPNVILIPEETGSRCKPYKLRAMRVGDKLMYTCINININARSYLLVTLEEVISAFGVSMDDVLIVLTTLHIEVYYPNKKMAKLLSSAEIDRTRGLIQIDDLIKYLHQIKYMLRLG